MQRAEQEEVRQREANETALLAIGPRKKMKLSNTPGSPSASNSQGSSSNNQLNSSFTPFGSTPSKTPVRAKD